MKIKNLLLLFVTIILSGCSSDYVDGIGNNPKLNICTYTFNKEGETIEVYSKKDFCLYLSFTREVANNNGNEPVIYRRGQNNRGPIERIDGGWYKVSIDNENKIVEIDVAENNTNQERILPITIGSINYTGHTNYIQQ